MNKLLFILFMGGFAVLAFSACARAQGDGAIHGVVLAQADRSPLPNSAVRLEGVSLPISLDTTTGDDGHFGFQRLVAAEYQLTISRDGFLEGRYRLTLRPREVLNMTRTRKPAGR